MKNSKTKLALRTETVRSLTATQLDGVAGGGDTKFCPNTVAPFCPPLSQGHC